MLLCKKIKLHVTVQDATTLEWMQGKCRGLDNWWAMKLKDGAKWRFNDCKKTLAESRVYDPELGQVDGKLLAEVYFRLDATMQAFFRRVKAGETSGFPRVRPHHPFFTLVYPALYIQVQGNTLRVPTGGKGAQKKRYPDILAELTEHYREVAISRDARGNYVASFAYRAEEQEKQGGQVAALDPGRKTPATGVNQQGRVYHIGGFTGAQWYNRQLDKIRSRRDTCQKKSRRYIHLSKVYKRVAEKKRNKQRDSLHKASHRIAHKLVESAVVIGDLSQRQMVMKEHRERNKHLNRSVNDWGLYTLTEVLMYKCQLSGTSRL